MSLQPNYLLQITLCRTSNPTVSRMLSVPSQITFTELHSAISAAFGWDVEPCTSWVFKMVDQNPLNISKRDDPNKLKTTFAALWTAPNQGYDMTPPSYGTNFPVGLWMKKTATGSGKFWTYDYNISKHPHAIEVMDTLTDDPTRKLVCVGGLGNIGRKAWQFADLGGLEEKVRAGGGIWVSDMTALNVKMGGIQGRFEERRKEEAELAAKPKANARKRAAPLGDEGVGADGVEVVTEKAVKKNRVRGPAKVKAEAKVKIGKARIKNETP